MTEKIAKEIKEIMKSEGMNAQALLNKKIHQQKVYSVLKMGKLSKKDYRISTLISILDAIGAEIEIKKK